MGVAGILFGTDVAPAATVMGIPTIDFQGPTLTIQTDPTTITASVGNFTKNLGDINGDGFDDFAIVDSSFGETYIWTAGADQLVTAMGTARTLADLFANTNNGFIFGYGGNRPQYSVETVGDVNGDGFDDFMVTTTANDILVYGASSFATTTNANGYEVYDYSGSVNTTANNYAEFSASQGAIGLEHKNIGDINGDGFDDFALGFAGDDLVGFTNNGSARIVFGSGTDFTGVTDLDTSSDLIIQGDSNTDRVGVSITNIGDFNGDGVDDFAVGAHTADDANGDVTGVVAIFFGSDTLTSSGTPVTFADADILIEGNVVNGEFGEILAGVGDFNGDGLADLAIGEELGGTVTNSTSDEAGQYYVLYGSQTLTGTVNAEDIGGTVAGVTGLGQTAGDRAATVADIGDVNGDGFADLAVGSALNADGGANAGSVYVVYGVDGGGSAVTIDEVGGPATDDAYIGSSTVDSIDVSEGDDYVSSGAGDDSIGVYGVYQDQNLNGAMSTTNRSVLADGGGGIDTLVLGRSAPGLVYFNLTDSTESIGALSFDPSQIETRNIERLGLDDAASVIIDITTVTSLLGQNIDGVRTLVIDYAGSGSNSSIFIADEADWSDNGTTTFEGTLYNLFVHSPTGAELYIQTGSNIGIFGTSLQNLKGAGQGKVSFVDVPLFEEEPIAEPVEASDEVAAPGLEDGPSYGFDLATQDEDALLIGVSEMLNAPVDLKDYLLASKEIGFEDLKRSPDDSSKAIGFEDLLPSREDEEQDIGFEDLRPSREDSDADIGFEDLRPSREGSDKDIGFEDLLLSSKDGANGLTSHATPADITSGETALGEADAAALKADLSDVQDQFVLDAVLAGMNETPVSAVEFSVSGQEAQVATFALENVADDLVYDEIGHDFA